MSALQFIGAAPGSTGGGVKVTTFAVIILTIRSVAQGRDDCVIAEHHIESKTVYRALTIIVLGGLAAVGSAVVVFYNDLGRVCRSLRYFRVLLCLWHSWPFGGRYQPAEPGRKDPVYAGHVHGPCRPGVAGHEPDGKAGRQQTEDHAGGAYQRWLNDF